MTFLSNKKLTRAYPTDAGLDIQSDEEVIIPGHSSKLISTGLKLAIQDGYVGMLKSRSGMAVNKGIDVAAGVIDSSYRGEVKVLLRNTNTWHCKISKGDKIAQLLTIPITIADYKVVGDVGTTDRGENGFGSSGK